MRDMKLFLLLIIPLFAHAQWVQEQENPGLYEGDMVLTPKQQIAEKNGKFGYASTKRNLWPKTIPYTVSSSLARNSKAMGAINAAIADYHTYTCLRFVKRTSQRGYIEFFDGGGCYSGVGYSGSRNKISLSRGCWHKGTTLHEIAHNLGFYHEQSRPDRDNHVTIQWHKINPNNKHNFNKQSPSNVDSLGTAYDFKSMMHYSKTAFGSPRGSITIKTKDPAMQNVIGQRGGFSEIDKKQINKLYCGGTGKNWMNPSRQKPVQRPDPPTGGPPVVTKIPPVVTKRPPPGCRDRHTNCKNFQRHCKSSGWIGHMKRNCKRTCNYC